MSRINSFPHRSTALGAYAWSRLLVIQHLPPTRWCQACTALPHAPPGTARRRTIDGPPLQAPSFRITRRADQLKKTSLPGFPLFTFGLPAMPPTRLGDRTCLPTAPRYHLPYYYPTLPRALPIRATERRHGAAHTPHTGIHHTYLPHHACPTLLRMDAWRRRAFPTLPRLVRRLTYLYTPLPVCTGRSAFCRFSSTFSSIIRQRRGVNLHVDHQYFWQQMGSGGAAHRFCWRGRTSATISHLPLFHLGAHLPRSSAPTASPLITTRLNATANAHTACTRTMLHNAHACYAGAVWGMPVLVKKTHARKERSPVPIAAAWRHHSWFMALRGTTVHHPS